jgi:hypothetical protein
MLARMGRRGSSSFRDYWHDRSLELDDGDVLRWLVIATPGREPRIAYFRRDRAGVVHASAGVELLRRAGHSDAELRIPADAPAVGAFH